MESMNEHAEAFAEKSVNGLIAVFAAAVLDQYLKAGEEKQQQVRNYLELMDREDAGQEETEASFTGLPECLEITFP